jgi:hypothetical protein
MTTFIIINNKMEDKYNEELIQKVGNLINDKYTNYYSIPKKYKYIYSVYKPPSCGIKRKNDSTTDEY